MEKIIFEGRDETFPRPTGALFLFAGCGVFFLIAGEVSGKLPMADSGEPVGTGSLLFFLILGLALIWAGLDGLCGKRKVTLDLDNGQLLHHSTLFGRGKESVTECGELKQVEVRKIRIRKRGTFYRVVLCADEEVEFITLISRQSAIDWARSISEEAGIPIRIEEP